MKGGKKGRKEGNRETMGRRVRGMHIVEGRGRCRFVKFERCEKEMTSR